MLRCDVNLHTDILDTPDIFWDEEHRGTRARIAFGLRGDSIADPMIASRRSGILARALRRRDLERDPRQAPRSVAAGYMLVARGRLRGRMVVADAWEILNWAESALQQAAQYAGHLAREDPHHHWAARAQDAWQPIHDRTARHLRGRAERRQHTLIQVEAD